MTTTPSTGPTPNISPAARTADGDTEPRSEHDDDIRAAFMLLPADQLAEAMANRMIIEQAKGMLMMIYGIDADRAFEVLRWRSQFAGVKLRVIAERLAGEMLQLAQSDQVDIRSACDAAVLTVHQRVNPPAGRTPLAHWTATDRVRVQIPNSVVAQWVI